MIQLSDNEKRLLIELLRASNSPDNLRSYSTRLTVRRYRLRSSRKLYCSIERPLIQNWITVHAECNYRRKP
jgi:hypothetical protein